MCDRLQVGSAGASDARKTDIAKAIGFNQLSQSSIYKQAEKTGALTVRGGTYGGGSECLIVTKKKRYMR